MAKQGDSTNREQRICLFGGTFDPIHLGHIHIARKAKEAFELEKVIFLPCKQSPHKQSKQHAEEKHRLAMCKLAISELPWAEVDDFDLTAPPPSYSWRTAESFAKKYPDSRLYWLMGTDQWEALPRWSRPEYLASLVEFIVFARGEFPKARPSYQLHALKGNHPASATAIRNELHSIKPPNKAYSHEWLSPKVTKYILQHKLYFKPSSEESTK